MPRYERLTTTQTSCHQGDQLTLDVSPLSPLSHHHVVHSSLQGTQDRDTASEQEAAGQPVQPEAPAAGQPEQQGYEVSTAAAKLVAEIVASPVFYLVAGMELAV